MLAYLNAFVSWMIVRNVRFWWEWVVVLMKLFDSFSYVCIWLPCPILNYLKPSLLYISWYDSFQLALIEANKTHKRQLHPLYLQMERTGTRGKYDFGFQPNIHQVGYYFVFDMNPTIMTPLT